MENYKKCQSILSLISSQEKLVLRSNASIKKSLRHAITKDNNRVESARLNYEKLKSEHDNLLHDVESLRLTLSEEKEELNAAQLKIEQVKNNAHVQPNSEISLRKDIEDLRDSLEVCGKITGTRFSFKSPDDMVSGFVGLKSKSPHDTKLIPFIHPSTSPPNEIANDIWEKIGTAVEEGN